MVTYYSRGTIIVEAAPSITVGIAQTPSTLPGASFGNLNKRGNERGFFATL